MAGQLFNFSNLIQSTFSRLPEDCCSMSELCINLCNLQCIEINIQYSYYHKISIFVQGNGDWKPLEPRIIYLRI